MPLQQFEDHQVFASGIEMPGAGGGLNAALRVDEMELHHGDTVTIVIEAQVVKVRFDPIKDVDGLQRVHVLRVENAAQIDSTLVDEVLEKQRIRVEEAAGVKRLPYGDDVDDADDPGDE